MNIQKIENGVKLKFQKSLMAELNRDGKSLSVVVKADGNKEIALNQPGEYEHEKLNIILKEVITEEEKFTGKPNLASITYQGITYTVLFEELEITKKLEDELPNTNVVLVPVTKGTKLKKCVKSLQPEKGVFMDLGNTDITMEKLASEFSKLLKAEDSKLKIKESELNSGEDLLQEFFIL